METLLPTLEIHPGPEPTAAMLFLHGLGAHAHVFSQLAARLRLPPDLPVRFVLPEAPALPVTANGGALAPAWFDVDRIGGEARDEEGIRRSTRQINRLIRREGQRGLPPGRVFLAGFSQGGAQALLAGLRQREPLAGIAVLSSYLSGRGLREEDLPEATRPTPVFLAHGTEDPVVPVALAEATREALVARGHPVTWHTHPVPHALGTGAIRDLAAWLEAVLREKGPPGPT